MLRRTLFQFLALFFLVISQPAVAQELRDLSNYLDRSVGRVLAFDVTGGGGTGSGYAVAYGENDEIYFLTNQHVIEGSASVLVVYGIEGETRTFEAEIVNQSPEYDMALLALSPTDGDTFRPEILQLADYTIEQGDQVYAIGFPGFADELLDSFEDPAFVEPLLTQGIIGKRQNTSWRDQDLQIEVLVHDAAISGGNSGGPLVNRCGAVVGLNTAAVPGVAGSSYASSAKSISAFLSLTGAAPTGSNGPCRGVVGGGFALSVQEKALVAAIVLIAILVAATIYFRSQVFPVRAVGRAGESLKPLPRARENVGHPVLLATIDNQTTSLSSDRLAKGVTIGRSAGADIQVNSQKLSRHHAKMIVIDRKIFIQDNESTNGTKVDGVTVAPKVPIQINTKSKVEMGGLEFKISMATA